MQVEGVDFILKRKNGSSPLSGSLFPAFQPLVDVVWIVHRLVWQLTFCKSNLTSVLTLKLTRPLHGTSPDSVYPWLPSEWQLFPGEDGRSAEVVEETSGACLHECAAHCTARWVIYTCLKTHPTCSWVSFILLMVDAKLAFTFAFFLTLFYNNIQEVRRYYTSRKGRWRIEFYVSNAAAGCTVYSSP